MQLSHPISGIISGKGYSFHRHKDFCKSEQVREKWKAFYFPQNSQTTYSIHLVYIAVHALFVGIFIIIAVTVSKPLGVYDP